MATGLIGYRFGGSAAAEESSSIADDAKPISLAGRWSGQYYGYASHSGNNRLSYDIVACKEGWCGIAVKDDQSCGAIGLHLAADSQMGERVFKGRLELVKGAAPYVVQAWHDISKDDGTITLHFVGDTGSELLMFRRSYPFEASLARTGNAVCTLDKATS